MFYACQVSNIIHLWLVSLVFSILFYHLLRLLEILSFFSFPNFVGREGTEINIRDDFIPSRKCRSYLNCFLILAQGQQFGAVFKSITLTPVLNYYFDHEKNKGQNWLERDVSSERKDERNAAEHSSRRANDLASTRQPAAVYITSCCFSDD